MLKNFPPPPPFPPLGIIPHLLAAVYPNCLRIVINFWNYTSMWLWLFNIGVTYWMAIIRAPLQFFTPLFQYLICVPSHLRRSGRSFEHFFLSVLIQYRRFLKIPSYLKVCQFNINRHKFTLFELRWRYVCARRTQAKTFVYILRLSMYSDKKEKENSQQYIPNCKMYQRCINNLA